MWLTVMATVGVDVVTGTGTAVGVGLGVMVGDAVGTDVDVAVGVTVAVAVGVTVGVLVGTAVGVGTGVGVGVGVGVAVGVAVGVGVGCPAMRVATNASTVASRSGVELPSGTTQAVSSVASPMSSNVAFRTKVPPASHSTHLGYYMVSGRRDADQQKTCQNPVLWSCVSIKAAIRSSGTRARTWET